jgi:EmrB/QacA subfamily drug resistance transporter
MRQSEDVTAPELTEAQADPRRWRALILLCAAQFVVVLDASIVNVALPSIKTALHFSQENLPWVVNAYTLTFGGFLLLGGRAADLLGRRRVFMSGLVIFSLASLAGGLATSEGWLIVARGVQGLGAAIVSPAALSIVTTTFREGSERNKALGIWGALAGAGGAAGVIAGGVLTDSLGWEWILFVNVPIGLAAALLAPRLIRESRLDAEDRTYDVAGAVSVTAGLIILVYTLVKANDFGWGSSSTIALLAVAVGLLAAFVAIEARSRKPLVPLGVFRLRSLTSANAIGLLIGASLFSMFFFISLYVQQVLGYSPLKTGVSYLPLTAGIIISAGAASALVTKVGFKWVLAGGMALIAIGLLMFTGVDPNGSYLSDVLPASIVVAFGLGFAFVPVTIAAVAGVQDDDQGLASGLINTSQQVGGALGLAILSAVATATTGDLLKTGSAMKPALTQGFQDAFAVGAGFAVLGLVLTLVLLPGNRIEEEIEAEAEGEVEPAAAHAAA